MIAARLSVHASGVRNVVEGLSAHLAARGHDVHVFGLGDRAWQAGDAVQWRGAPATAFPVRGPAECGFAPDMFGALMRFDPDIVHLHSVWQHTALVAERWAARTGRPLVVSPHNAFAPEGLARSRVKKRLARIAYLDRCLRRAAWLHATNRTEAAQFRAFGLTGPIAVYPNGVDDIAPHVSAPRKKRIVTLGRIHPIKGLDRLLRAWARIAPDHPDWSLAIAGQDEAGHARRLRAMIDALALKRVTLSGPLYGPDKARFLAQAGLFVLPTRRDNFALTVAEALVCRTPVVASHGAPWGGLETHGCGWWVEGTDAALADAMARAMVLTDERRAQMGEAGRAWVRAAFTWPAVAARAETAYRTVVQPHARPHRSAPGTASRARTEAAIGARADLG